MRLTLTLSVLIAALCSPAVAQDYPSRPIKVVVPYAAGSTGEAAFRIIANEIEPALGQRFVVEAKPGAGGNIGAAAVASAEPDGYTLLLGATNNFAINQFLYPKLGFDPATGFAPISVLVDLPFFVYASSETKASSLPELITLAKNTPGGLNYASSGIGSPMHLGALLLGDVAGVQMTHVPYRSNAQSISALLANDVQLYIGLISNAQELVETGKLRIVATAGPQRSLQFPNVASASEQGYPKFKMSNWWGLAAPRGTPPAIVEKLSKLIAGAVANPTVKDRLLQVGMVAVGNTPAEFAEQIKREAAIWQDVVKAANITLN